MAEKYFTVQEARQLLPRVRELMGKVVSLAAELENFRDAVQKFADAAALNSGGAEGAVYLSTLLRLHHHIEQVQETGCLIKDVRQGLVDFPHWKDGREVYLCWQYDEEDIRFWHEIDAGFAGRTPLLE